MVSECCSSGLDGLNRVPQLRDDFVIVIRKYWDRAKLCVRLVLASLSTDCSGPMELRRVPFDPPSLTQVG